MVQSARGKWLLMGAVMSIVVLLFFGSMVWGYTATTWRDVLDAYTQRGDTIEQHVIRDLRTPRAVVAAIVGAALAVSGTLMQAITRNPLAGPSLLGINAGAGLAVVLGVTVIGLTEIRHYVWFAFLGAGLTALAVYGIASVGKEGPTPLKLTLAGAAISALISSLTSGLLILNENGLQSVMFWMAGSVEGRPLSLVWPVLPLLAAGFVLALAVGRSLNTFALGEDIAKSLGQRTGLLRLVVSVAVLLLAGSSVAIAGPIGFIGLVIPHVTRWLVGRDYTWIIPGSALLGASLLLLSDIGARFLLFPREVPVGTITALVGAPFFIYLARTGSKT